VSLMNRMTPRLRVPGPDGPGLLTALACALVLVALPLPAAAQFPAPPDPVPAPAKPAAKPAPPKPVERPKPRPARAGEVQTDPIKCWWKTDTTEVRVGQRFNVTLTCGVIETPSMKVIPNINALDPGAVQLTPFEVAGGTKRDDILSPPWRYFQYEYQVRLLSEGFFGKEVPLPALRVTYNVQASAGGGAEGRDLTYQLPPIPMRVASLVPSSAADIRDASSQGFETISTRRFRASTAWVMGLILIGFSLVVLLLAAARAFGRLRRRQPVGNKPVAPVAVRGAAVRALTTVKAAVARDGWSPALVRRVQSVLRLASAMALGRPMSQTAVAEHTTEREGQLLVQQGTLRRRWAMLSAASTTATIDRALAEDRSVPARTRTSLETLRNAMQLLNTAGYGRPGGFDTPALDRALDESIDAIKQLRLGSGLPLQTRQPTRIAGLGSPSISGDRA
jgi:hypothetical protein